MNFINLFKYLNFGHQDPLSLPFQVQSQKRQWELGHLKPPALQARERLGPYGP